MLELTFPVSLNRRGTSSLLLSFCKAHFPFDYDKSNIEKKYPCIKVEEKQKPNKKKSESESPVIFSFFTFHSLFLFDEKHEKHILFNMYFLPLFPCRYLTGNYFSGKCMQKL